MNIKLGVQCKSDIGIPRARLLGEHVLAACQNQNASAQSGEAGRSRLAKEVRHELVMLPYYNVFDNLAFRIDRSQVTLPG